MKHQPSISSEQVRAMEVCVAHNIPFALYKQPGEHCCHFIASMPDDDEMLNDHEAVPGSVEITFYNNENDHNIVIQPQFTAAEVLSMMEPKTQAAPDVVASSRSTTALAYLSAAHGIIRDLKQHKGKEMSKVVLSRIIAGETPVSPLAEIVSRYFEGGEATLRYVYFTQETGLWIGATPEVLVAYATAKNSADSDKGVIRSMSLAGTRATAPQGTPWDAKNMLEQNIVTAYVEGVMGETTGLKPIAENSTMRLNDIEHLCTTLTVASSFAEAMKIRTLLDPTPAVCGYPCAYAKTQIAKYEAHERLCYSGTITIHADIAPSFTTYVNLRCALLEPEGDTLRYNIFVGGGLTFQSTPESEWDETNRKAARIIRALTGSEPKFNDLHSQIAIDQQAYCATSTIEK